MDSCLAFHGHGEGDNNTIFPIRKRPSSRRNHSLSCSSSFGSSSSLGSSSFEDSSPLNPITARHLSGIPFSWEQHPGIPKKILNSRSLPFKNKPLPPPPPNPTASKKFNLEPILSTQKKNNQDILHIDPFAAALVECSRDRRREGLKDCWKETKVSRTVSDRFGFIDLYGSCKNSCAVSDSTVYIPRSSRGSYHLLNRRTG
ncbi:hypothetical protein NE237_024071 [Protea cynaroides]|uniref:Uncharacterized protein n=1 Tax=Protea cynaroides TaxID=273540 RepID=A0A9Q0HCZ4_9MAGN|nr:hypothetical protein NE237_024071 [Protea cynaroides]